MVAVAIDFQGAAKAQPFVEQARATYSNVVDTGNVLSEYFGFKALPNAIFVDEAGVIRYTHFGGFDIRKPEHRHLAEHFATSPDLSVLAAEAKDVHAFENAEVLAHFQAGLAHYRAGDTQAALTEWRKGVALDPDNWIMRKQIWAIENPARFYAGEIDTAWQKEQITQQK